MTSVENQRLARQEMAAVDALQEATSENIAPSLPRQPNECEASWIERRQLLSASLISSQYCVDADLAMQRTPAPTWPLDSGCHLLG